MLKSDQVPPKTEDPCPSPPGHASLLFTSWGCWVLLGCSSSWATLVFTTCALSARTLLGEQLKALGKVKHPLVIAEPCSQT